MERLQAAGGECGAPSRLSCHYRVAPPTYLGPFNLAYLTPSCYHRQLVLRFLHFFCEREGLSSAEVQAAREERRVLSHVDGTRATHSAHMCNGGSAALVPSITYF